MHISNKEKYIDFCNNTNVYIPIFSQPWWLEAVTYGKWDVIIAENGEVLALNPYYYVEHDNGLEIRKATLTANNGVLFNYPPNIKYVSKISFERKALELIIKQLEMLNIISYRQYFHYSFTNWLPYYWHGFEQTTRYTYVIEETDLVKARANMDSKLRNQIKKATSLVEVGEDMDIDDFYTFNIKTFERQGVEIPYSRDLVRRIHRECRDRNQSKILYASDKKGNMHSAIYLIEDDQSVYYLLAGSDPKYRDSQSLSLLIEKGIEYALSKNKKFDFEGTMKQNLEKNFSQFGGVQKPYMNISKNYD